MPDPTWAMSHPVILFLNGEPFKLNCGCPIIVDKDIFDSSEGSILIDLKHYTVDRYEAAELNTQNVREICHLKEA